MHLCQIITIFYFLPLKNWTIYGNISTDCLSTCGITSTTLLHSFPFSINWMTPGKESTLIAFTNKIQQSYRSFFESTIFSKTLLPHSHLWYWHGRFLLPSLQVFEEAISSLQGLLINVLENVVDKGNLLRWKNDERFF